ncbi:MAG: GNAT family N-acetyltransferase [Anaerolineae bacterium]|nr:GNAT family N-acetyltransferase [Anaerolineae bacterium]
MEIEITALKELSLADLQRVASGYTSTEQYRVRYVDSDIHTVLELLLVAMKEPHKKVYDHFDEETLQRYNQARVGGFSFGAYEADRLVGLLIAEVHAWNHSLWVWEFHVDQAYRGQGLGRQLMERAAEAARQAGLRTIVCETQNTNAAAIHAYRKLGFRVEGVDISYYTNQDYPDGEMAVFMKRRLD